MSPCCLSPRTVPTNPDVIKALESVKTAAEAVKLTAGRIQLASAAAWSPNPNNPPLYVDLPIGEAQQSVLAKWASNAPLTFLDQYITSMRQYRGIAIDVGDQDGLRVDTAKLHDALDKYGIKNSFEQYQGTHTSKMAVRFQNYVMKFFSENLCFEKVCR